ncbi:MAG: hypothetical protein V4719_26175 [Planctomycetota bacterium]
MAFFGFWCLGHLDVSAQEVQNANHEKRGFPDFGFMVSSSEYIQKYSDQPVFRLKADFPTEKPKQLPDFMAIDFKKEPKKYIEAVRDYAFEGNLPHWDPYKNKTRNWYHIPWLHPTTTGPNAYPPNGGTEGFHGLIKEAPLSSLQLGPHHQGIPGDYSVYAITLVNDMAGYAMGRMWNDPENPDPKVLDKRFGRDNGFPEGTVFAKLLFTDAPKGTDRVDYLKNPLQWKAYITENFWLSPTRVVSTVNLLQLDISVRDPRANRSPQNPQGTGWVFGTFCYNGMLNHENKFMNLVPLGIMWGNDPEDKTNKTSPFPPTLTVVNKDLKETVIFEDQNLPPQHLGWNGRLNGPADLNTVSCMSCHNAAQYPQTTSLVPVGAVPDGGLTPPTQGGTDEWMKWFQNVECGTSMNPQTYSTDFSFQVAIALQNFYNVKSINQQGNWASEYKLAIEPIRRGRTLREYSPTKPAR